MIDRRTIAGLLGEVEAGGPVLRSRVRSSLSAFFNWAITEGIIDGNPVTDTAKAEEGGSRERVIAALWHASPIEPVGQRPRRPKGHICV